MFVAVSKTSSFINDVVILFCIFSLIKSLVLHLDRFSNDAVICGDKIDFYSLFNQARRDDLAYSLSCLKEVKIYW